MSCTATGNRHPPTPSSLKILEIPIARLPPIAWVIMTPVSSWKSDMRQFECAGCQQEVVTCSTCDRGHRYCHRGCARQALADSRRRAGQRYQKTRRGRLMHARRQHRYRLRVARRLAMAKKVTHQGFSARCPNALLPSDRERRRNGNHSRAAFVQCHLCGRLRDMPTGRLNTTLWSRRIWNNDTSGYSE